MPNTKELLVLRHYQPDTTAQMELLQGLLQRQRHRIADTNEKAQTELQLAGRNGLGQEERAE